MEQQNNNHGRDQYIINHIDSQSEEEQFASVAYLLMLEIQQDCKLLQELLDQEEQSYLSDKWRSCFSQNRSVWQDLTSRLSLARSNRTLMQDIQCFYRKLDDVEEHCRRLLDMKAKIMPHETKPRYGGSEFFGFDTPHPPAWAEKYYLESDAIAVISGKKLHSREFKKLKGVVHEVLEFANRIIRFLENAVH